MNYKQYIKNSITPLTCAIFFIFSHNASAFNMIDLTIDGDIKEQITSSDISIFVHKTILMTRDPNYKTELLQPKICLDQLEPCLTSLSTRDRYTTRAITQTDVDRNAVKTFVEDIARKIDTDPVNARLKFNEEKGGVEDIKTHADGMRIDVGKNIEKIADVLNQDLNTLPKTVELTYQKDPAKITSENAKDLGITELIGEGISDFSGSTKSRIHNIVTASKRFDGLVIAPNEEFSFVNILGPVDGEHGYKEELVIRDNETKPEYGGGICQVSTTVFRGAIFTGMKITQRRNHSYPVHYYTPTGFDATVYVPAPDFRFINNTPGHLLLNTEMEGTKLKFKFYGTSDGRNVEMNGPYVTERQENGAMKTYFTQKVIDKNGNTIIDDIFKSDYKSPDDYPHPEDVANLTTKPDNWSKKEWKEYQEKNGL
jgi:vancomycin resistance protein YoaR